MLKFAVRICAWGTISARLIEETILPSSIRLKSIRKSVRSIVRSVVRSIV